MSGLLSFSPMNRGGICEAPLFMPKSGRGAIRHEFTNSFSFAARQGESKKFKNPSLESTALAKAAARRRIKD
jgi:hypothetical protein